MSVIISIASSILADVNPIVLAACIIFLSFSFYVLFINSSNPSGDPSSERVFEGKHWTLDLLLKENKVYTREEVALHCDETDCWVTIDNWVFDLTKFLPRHPGGSKILVNRAGQDCTRGFHGFQHPENAYTNLRDYIIGYIKSSERVQWIDKEQVQENNWYEFKDAVYSTQVTSTKEAKMFARHFIGYIRQSIPIEVVHTHDQEWDCWIIIHDKVYDVTHWALEHPGGTIIRSRPGQDVTELFEIYHSGNERIKTKMQEFFVGNVLKR